MIMELVNFIAQSENHFFGTLILMGSFFTGLTMVARSLRGNHCGVCHKRFAQDDEEDDEL